MGKVFHKMRANPTNLRKVLFLRRGGLPLHFFTSCTPDMIKKKADSSYEIENL